MIEVDAGVNDAHNGAAVWACTNVWIRGSTVVAAIMRDGGVADNQMGAGFNSFNTPYSDGGHCGDQTGEAGERKVKQQLVADDLRHYRK